MQNVSTAPSSQGISPGTRRHRPGVFYCGDGARRELALTFDDGPHPQDTPPLLEVLEKHRLRATFHLVGKGAERHPDLVHKIHQAGHQPALHCYRHIPFPLENPARLRAALDHTRVLIADAAGIAPATIRDLRPPYGLLTARTVSHLVAWGYRPVLWSIMPLHWVQPTDRSIRQILESIHPGAVIVLHDGHGHGKWVGRIVEAIVPSLRSLGYDFVTVEEMQRRRELPPAPLNTHEEAIE